MSSLTHPTTPKAHTFIHHITDKLVFLKHKLDYVLRMPSSALRRQSKLLPRSTWSYLIWPLPDLTLIDFSRCATVFVFVFYILENIWGFSNSGPLYMLCLLLKHSDSRLPFFRSWLKYQSEKPLFPRCISPPINAALIMWLSKRFKWMNSYYTI